MTTSGQIFVSSRTSVNQISSALFNDFGNRGDIPSPVSLVNILPLQQNFNSSLSLFRDNLSLAIFASKMDAFINYKERVTLMPLMYDEYECFPTPNLVFSFEGPATDEIKNKLSNINFRKEASGRRHYYRGPGTISNLEVGIDLGTLLDSFGPADAVNVQGFLAIRTAKNLLGAAIQVISEPLVQLKNKVETTNPFPIQFFEKDEEISSFTGKTWKCPNDGVFAIPVKKIGKLIITDPNVKHAGIFFPYFDGLVLPDKEYVSRFILSRLISGLGSDDKSVITNSQTIRTGWRSAATTVSGMQMSHAFFVLDLALQTGAKPVIFAPNGRYHGMVLFGRRLKIMKHGTITTSVSQKDLAKIMSNFDHHETSLKTIADILTKAPYVEDEVIADVAEKRYETVYPKEIDSPRRLHNLIRIRTLSPDDTSKIKKEIPHLRFETVFWNGLDPEKIYQLIVTLGDKDYLEHEAPFAYKTEALFTKDYVLSSLAAFGNMAPSLIGSGSTTTIPIMRVQNKLLYETTKFQLKGLPVFMKPLNEAFNDWKLLMRKGIITFRTKGVDPAGFAKIAGEATFISKSHEFYRRIEGELISNFSEVAKKQAELKRQREDYDEGEELRDSGRTKRKLVHHTEGQLLLGSFLPQKLVDVGALPTSEDPVINMSDEDDMDV